uniref:H15 domain-containing protein n=1 Tax=Echinostoma caproni TaxID=27848 RepID=A0A183B453_9TREM
LIMSAPAADPAKKPKTANPKAPVSHPPVIYIVEDRKGPSLPTIKKYIAVNYKVDVAKLGPHIRRGIVHAVENGVLVHVGNKAKGKSGRFKLDEKKATVKKPEAPKVKKAATPNKPKVAKKPLSLRPRPRQSLKLWRPKRRRPKGQRFPRSLRLRRRLLRRISCYRDLDS